MFLFLLLLTIPFLSATPVPWKNCGTPQDHLKISTLDATPFPPQAGKDITFTGAAVLDEVVYNGTVEVKVKFYGAELFHGTLVICDLDPSVKCPIAAGPISLSRTEALPTQIPKGPYELSAIAKDSKGQPLFCVIVPFTIKSQPAIDVEMVDQINRMHTTWTAGMNNKFATATIEQAKQLCGVLEGGERLPVKQDEGSNVAVPEEFDAREQWGTMCPSVKRVRDQGPCGSCWAFGAAHAMTDRMCIGSQGALTMDLSAGDTVSCCWFCGMGCSGGYPPMAWKYWQTEGLVTGGFHEDGDGCLPYYWDRCEHHTTGKYPPCGDTQKAPGCKKECKAGYPKKWTDDRHYAKSSYSVAAHEEAIKTEIYEHGPVEAAFTVYQDFLAYKTGVYKHTTGEYLGGHAISLYGWGVEEGTPYWIVKNSWNEDWGDGGFFKILRGKNECGIEQNVVAGEPK